MIEPGFVLHSLPFRLISKLLYEIIFAPSSTSDIALLDPRSSPRRNISPDCTEDAMTTPNWWRELPAIRFTPIKADMYCQITLRRYLVIGKGSEPSWGRCFELRGMPNFDWLPHYPVIGTSRFQGPVVVRYAIE